MFREATAKQDRIVYHSALSHFFSPLMGDDVELLFFSLCFFVSSSETWCQEMVRKHFVIA